MYGCTCTSSVNLSMFPSGMTPPSLPQLTVIPSKLVDMLQTRVTVVHSVAMVTVESPCVIRGAAEITSIMTNKTEEEEEEEKEEW